MPNYGDVALGLSADWSRSKYENQGWMLGTVGHENGKADAYLTDEPEKEHQFRWINFHDHDEVVQAQMQHYEFITKDRWTIHPILWKWDGENHCYYAGQRLMARAKEYWLADQARRDGRQAEAKREADREMDDAPKGLIPTDENDVPRRRKRGI